MDSPAAPASGPGIEVRGLTRRFGRVTAIEDLTFSIPRGGVVGFLGPNGAGKSTTLRILGGLLPATSGYASVCGISLARHPDRLKPRLGYMPENNPLPEEIRVGEYLRFRGRLKNLRGRRLRERVDTVMEQCDLARKARRKIIGTLSKGFRQRVGLAEALLAEPEVILLDEPTIGLDPHQIRAFRQLINGLRGRMTIILSSHILSEIEMCCDHVIIINHGRIVAQGTPSALRREFLPEVAWTVEARGDFAALQAALQAVPGVVVRPLSADAPDGGPHRFSVHAGFTADPSEALAAAVLATPGAALRGLQREEADLEAIFLAATRRTWEQTLAHGNTGSTPPFPRPR